MTDRVDKLALTREMVALELLLDTYGGDSQHWPAARRSAAEILLQRPDDVGRAARQLLVQARAFDTILAAQPAVDHTSLSRLGDRIFTLSQQPETSLGQSARVVSIRGGLSRQNQLTATMSRHRSGWATAALLAASLLIGVFVGPGIDGLPALHEAADAVGLGGYLDQLALGTIDDASIRDEDVL